GEPLKVSLVLKSDGLRPNSTSRPWMKASVGLITSTCQNFLPPMVTGLTKISTRVSSNTVSDGGQTQGARQEQPFGKFRHPRPAPPGADGGRGVPVASPSPSAPPSPPRTMHEDRDCMSSRRGHHRLTSPPAINRRIRAGYMAAVMRNPKHFRPRAVQKGAGSA